MGQAKGARIKRMDAVKNLSTNTVMKKKKKNRGGGREGVLRIWNF